MRWNVTVTRTAVASLDVEVEAETRDEAESKAAEQAHDTDFTGCTVDYEFGVGGAVPVDGEESDLPPGYRYLDVGEIVKDTDKRWETPDQNPGMDEAGMEAQWVEVPSICIGETVDNPREYIREEPEVDLASEEKRCPDLGDGTCALCPTVFPGVSDEIIDAGWVPSYWIGEEEQEGPVCPNCSKQFLVTDPQYGESVLNLRGEYLSQWDGGVEVKAPCTVDPRTRKVVIDRAAGVEGLETMEREYVLLNGKEYEAANEEERHEFTPEEQSRMFFWK